MANSSSKYEQSLAVTEVSADECEQLFWHIGNLTGPRRARQWAPPAFGDGLDDASRHDSLPWRQAQQWSDTLIEI